MRQSVSYYEIVALQFGKCRVSIQFQDKKCSYQMNQACYNFITMKIKSKGIKKLWSEGQATTPFVAPKYSFPRSERFSLQSIYWPDKTEKSAELEQSDAHVHREALKISKMIDEEERHARGARLNRRTMSCSQPDYDRIAVGKSINELQCSRLLYRSKVQNPQSQTVVERLYSKCPQRTSPDLRDKYGFRTCKLQEQSAMSTCTSFYTNKQKGLFLKGKRFDLSRPQNFNPGPGAYRIQRYLDEKLKKLQKK